MGLINAVSAGSTSSQSKAKSIQLAVCDDLYISSEQATLLMGHSVDNVTDPHAIVEHFLPQIESTFEACKFLTLNLAYDEILLLRTKMGNLFRVITGNPSGFYIVDLSKKQDVKLLKRLNEINCFDKGRAIIEHPTRNTSQRGDWENFRNEKLNGKPIQLNSSFFHALPNAGRLQFDFVSTAR